MRFIDKFTEHPASVGESYTQHLVAALGFAGTLLRAAFCCAVHALLPFLFEKTGSTLITELHDRMVKNRSRLAAAGVDGDERDGRSVESTA